MPEMREKPILNLRGRLVRFDRALVMGILNLTPDSFYAPSRLTGSENAVSRAGDMLRDGADIIDVGACSTRPGSQSATEEEEFNRLEEPLVAIRRAYPDAIISIDTFRASIAEWAVKEAGVDIVNDVSCGADPAMAGAVAANGTAYVLMHSRGTPTDMDTRCQYGEDMVADVVRELAFKLDELRGMGVADVIIDPGFGFAKTALQNFELLGRLDCLKVLECPVLVGISRKRMTREEAKERGSDDAAESLVSTIALNTAALMKGADIIRVHDVKEGAVTVRNISKLIEIQNKKC